MRLFCGREKVREFKKKFEVLGLGAANAVCNVHLGTAPIMLLENT
jgi:hypothetical protein